MTRTTSAPTRILILALAATTGCGRSDGPALHPAPAPVPVLAPGIHQQTIAAPSGTIRCTISVPQGYDGKKQVPLVLALHYAGEVTPFFGRGVLTELVEPGLHDLGAVILSPDALEQDWTTHRNEEAVLALVDGARKSYAIDPKKVLVTGYSMGGQGTWFFAGKYPDRFTGAIPVAGHPGSKREWHTPVYAIHSRRDEILALGPTQTRIDELKAQGVNARLVVLDGPSHYDVPRYAGPLRDAVPWLRDVWK
jgi:poly(3-hydroxybutyrate) depolymerase